MTPSRFQSITEKYAKLRIGVIGDFCLDRYLEIDPRKTETSIETGLPVHNVTHVRSQPGGAGTIVNNLAALGIGAIYPLGFAGEDGEGYELTRALAAVPGVRNDYFIQTRERHTFTYCKPLILEPGKTPRELSRLDQKNWTPTPAALSARIAANLTALAAQVDALILLSQVDVPETGVLTASVLEAARKIAAAHPHKTILADSRLGLRDFPPVIFKMNAAELASLTGTDWRDAPGQETRPTSSAIGGDPVGRVPSRGAQDAIPNILQIAKQLAQKNGRPVFITLSERGIIGASPDGQAEHVPAHPVRGEIDIVGAGDAVTANLTAALAAGADLRESLELANTAASVVIHQLGTTGTASVNQLQQTLSW